MHMPFYRTIFCKIPVNILKAFLPSSILATSPARLNILDLITLIILGEGYEDEVPHSEAFSTPHFGPNIRLRILFSNTLSLHLSLNVRDHVI